MTHEQEDRDFEQKAALQRLHDAQEAQDKRPRSFWGLLGLFKRVACQVGLRKMVVGTLLAAAAYGVLGQTMGGVNNEAMSYKVPDKGSAVVTWLRESIDRERRTGWGPSATVLQPAHMRIDMKSFQDGQRKVWQRVAQRLETDITRAGISTPFDDDIKEVRFRLTLGDHWSPLFFFDSRLSTSSSLGVTVDHLDSFQKRLAMGKAHLYPRIDNLSYLVGDITNVLGDAQARMHQVAGRAGLFVGPDTRAVTYDVLGVMNASCGLLKAAGQDFGKVVEYQSIADIYPLTVERVCASVGDYPPVGDNTGGKVAQLDADVSGATNQLEALQRALAAEARMPGPGLK